MPEHRYILDMRVDATSYADTVNRALFWAREAESRYICVANAHMVMEGWDSPAFRRVVNAADLVTPDGMPLVWMLRRLGIHSQQRVCGPVLMPTLCAAAERDHVPVGFYGGRPEHLNRLVDVMQMKFPRLMITFASSPPFRALTSAEDQEVVRQINASNTRILFVGLGCPKQEWWMARHVGSIQAVMVGVGAAFQINAGLAKQAPPWMQAAGMEWLYRLGTEPRRLLVRYLKHNPRFVALAGLQALLWR